MAQERTFTLIGNFRDNISPSLKKINASLAEMQGLLKDLTKLSQKRGKNQLAEGFKAAQEEAKTLGKVIDGIAKKGFEFDRSGIKAAIEDVKVLSKEIDNTAKNGFQLDRSGLKAAQEDATVLGEILKANALIKVGEGFGDALTAGAHSAMSILSRGSSFFGKQFTEAVGDQMEDLQARGSLFGALTKQGLLKGGSVGEMEEGYRQTKIISRANESAIGDLIRTSSVSTSVVTTLNRQMTDNLLPTLLKARGITSLSGLSRDEMDKIFGGEKGIGKELARTYEKMATIIPSPQYASMSAMGFTQAITSGTINKQLSVFENNPVLVDALRTIDGGIQGTSDIGKRIQILQKALEVAAPTMMLDEMRQTIGGGMQAVQDTIMNPTVGILSLGADIANEGKRTLQQYKESGAYQLQMERARANLEKLANKRKLQGLEREKFIADNMKKLSEKLSDAIESADSPIEKISVALAPVLQSFASFLNTFGNLFIGPVTSIMNSLYKPLAALQRSLDYLSTDIEEYSKTGGKKGRSIGEALGRAVAEVFKALAAYFNPEKAGKEIGGGIQKFFADFKKGFDSLQGEKWVKMVMDSFKDILMNLIFNEGQVMKGLTPLGDSLIKVFALLAAPAFINSLISGLIPIAIMSMGKMIKVVFASISTSAAASAAGAAGGRGRGGAAGLSTLFLGRGGAARARLARMRAAAAARGMGRSPYAGPIGPTPAHTFYKGGRTSYMRPGLTAAGKAQLAMGKTAKAMEGIASFGKAAGKVAKGLPLLSIAIGLFDFTARKMAGDSTGRAAGGSIGAGLGGVAGGFLGTFLDPILGPFGTIAGGIVGSIIGDWIGTQIGGLVENLPSQLTAAWQQFEAWIRNLPYNLGFAIGRAMVIIQDSVIRLNNWLAGLSAEVAAWLGRVVVDLRLKWQNFSAQVAADFQSGAIWGKLRDALVTGFKNMMSTLSVMLNPGGALAKWFSDVFTDPRLQQGIRAGQVAERSASAAPVIDPNSMLGKVARNPANRAEGGLGDAISSEMRNKPRGSDLVIANSSETIIPAAGGLGMEDFMKTLRSGFDVVTSTLSKLHETTNSNQKYNKDQFTSLTTRTEQNQRETNERFTSMDKKLQKLSEGGAMFGMGGPGNIISVGKSLLAMGLEVGENPFFQYGSGYLPGGGGRVGGHAQGSYHYLGRALDVSGPPGLLDRAYQMLRGTNPSELLWRVPGHYDHLHVAYGMGPGSPAFFSSASQARAWEKKMAPTNASIATVTGNSAEGFGGGMTLNAPITIYQQPYQDAEELASMVAIRIGMAVSELRNHG